MYQIVEEVEVCTQFIVPRLLGLELDALEQRGIFGVVLGDGLLHILMCGLCLLGCGHDNSGITLDVVLNNVAKHLDIKTSGPVTFGNDSIDVAAIVKLIGQTELGKQLAEISFLLMLIKRQHTSNGVLPHDRELQTEVATGVVLDFAVGVVIAQAKRSGQTIGKVDIRLVEYAQIELWSMELAGHQHLYTNTHTAGLLDGGLGSGFWHAG